MANIHLPFGGSTAQRDLMCGQWRELSKKLPKRPAGAAADEGNLLHDAMEAHYMDGISFASLVGKLQFNGITLTSDHVKGPLTLAKDAMEQILNDYGIEEFTCEPFVQMVKGKVGGSIDLIGRGEGVTLIADYKFGKGAVKVSNNAQLLFYAMCAMHDKTTEFYFKNCSKLVFAIIQPELSETAYVWETTVDEVETFKELYLQAIQTTDRIATGKHCQFCPAQAVCPAHKANAHAALLLSTDTAEEISESLRLIELLEPWMRQVKDHAEELLKQGAQIPDYKLVQGQAKSKWSDDAEIKLKAAFGEAAYEKKLIGITQARKLAKNAEISIDELVVLESNTVKVVHISDSRPAKEIELPSRLKNL